MTKRVVFKYPLNYGTQQVFMPRYARPLSVGVQGQSIVMWAAIEPDAELVEHRVHVVLTGEGFEFNPGDCLFLGTVTIPTNMLPNGLVAHVFIEYRNCSWSEM